MESDNYRRSDSYERWAQGLWYSHTSCLGVRNRRDSKPKLLRQLDIVHARCQVVAIQRSNEGSSASRYRHEAVSAYNVVDGGAITLLVAGSCSARLTDCVGCRCSRIHRLCLIVIQHVTSIRLLSITAETQWPDPMTWPATWPHSV